MTDQVTCGVAGRRAQAGRGYDLVTSKVRRPQVRPGMVRRSSLLERLARGDAGPIVSVVAPPGYGKTTLLSQWAERDGQAFAWVSVEEGDNDPKVLLCYIAEALDVVEPIDQRVFDALTGWLLTAPHWSRQPASGAHRSHACLYGPMGH